MLYKIGTLPSDGKPARMTRTPVRLMARPPQYAFSDDDPQPMRRP